MFLRKKKQGIKFQIYGFPTHKTHAENQKAVRKGAALMKEIFNLCTWWKCCSSKNLLQKSSKFYTFSQARGYTAGVSQKAARHRWHRGITCCISPVGFGETSCGKKTDRKTSTHFAHLRMFVYSWVFAATTASFGKYLIHISPTSNLPLKYWVIWERFPIWKSTQQLPRKFRLFSCNIQLATADATSRVSATCIWKVDTHHQAKRNKKIVILLIEEIFLTKSPIDKISKSKVMLNFSSINGNMTVQRTHSKYPQNTRHSRPFSLGRRFLGRGFLDRAAAWTALILREARSWFSGLGSFG